MDVLWPGFVLLLGILPLLIALYIVILRRRRRFAVRYSSLSLVREALPRSSWRRHLPFALFLLGLASLVGAMARPVAAVSVPTNQTIIILALDVSRSMCSTDIAPNRLEAAKAAAQSFIQRQRPGTQIGIVAFAGYAEVVQPPTSDLKGLERAVDSLITGSRTAIGSGILRSIDAIAEIDQNVAPSVTGTSGGPRPTPVPKGTYAPDIIVLLTDGANNAGPAPLEAAQQAVDRGIRVYTIGFGTENGAEFPICDPRFQGSEPFAGGFPGGGGGGGMFRRGIDEATLRQVAERTDGEYYAAESAGELEEVFRRLPTNLITKTETIEISVAFAALGALLAALAISLSLSWHPFP
ncbi:MAG: Aerotolerance protein BatA [uncultured Thermomicrobiales bacterium]|uniref:Aerotolerance protein BatA n=1 Tax=uncultured Thermomicrobiales bacterium TaxID=1645740 RepID=A0A6J4URL2_9BACT|nr:MAG: Aerotolerance protein BatA [uncultured Thermomicrobiales bacterium]